MKNKFHEEIIKPVQEKETLMRANRFLSSKYALTAVIILISAVSFFFFNYCLNTLIALFKIWRISAILAPASPSETPFSFHSGSAGVFMWYFSF